MNATRHVTAVQSSLLQPSSVLPSQYFGSPGQLTPEQKLMIAILQDAVDCVAKYRRARDTLGRRLYNEATVWLLDQGTEWPFSFASICAMIELDAHAVRSALRLLERSGASTTSAPVPRRAAAAVETNLAEAQTIG